MNKTWKEIFDADCVTIYVINNGENSMEKTFATLLTVSHSIDRKTGNPLYTVTCKFYANDGTSLFMAHSEDGYPQLMG